MSSALTVAQLRTALRERNLDATGSKADLVARLDNAIAAEAKPAKKKRAADDDAPAPKRWRVEDLKKMTVYDLREELSARQLPTAGRKNELVERLAALDDDAEDALLPAVHTATLPVPNYTSTPATNAVMEISPGDSPSSRQRDARKGKEKIKDTDVHPLDPNRLQQPSREVRPSDLGTRSAEVKIQFNNSTPKFICYRGPPEARPAVPLLLAYEGYLRFRSNAQSMVAESQDLHFARKLWELSSVGWNDEVKEMTPQLNALFGSYLGCMVFPTGIGKNYTDGLVERTSILFEHKLTTSDGYLQGLEYLRTHFLLLRNNGLLSSCGMLVLVIRPYIQFVAVAMDWKRQKVIAEPLTPLLNCFGAPQHELNVLAAALRAFRLFYNGYDRLVELDPAVPYVFNRKPVQQLEGKLVFIVESDMVAKLCMTYSEKAHQLWAEKGVAPPLYRVTEIGAGWLFVEMACLGSKDGWRDAKDVLIRDPASHTALTDCVKAAARKGHSTGYVHGDLRLPNIRVRPRADGSFDVMFVDFDWAGKVGEATYPTLLNPDIEWHKDADYGKPILEEHDLHFVNDLAGQL